MPRRAAVTRWAVIAGLALWAVASRAWFLNGPQIDYDEGVYWQSLRALAGGHALYSSVYDSQPPGFLLLLSPFFGLLGHSLLAARLGVTLVSLLGVASAYLVAGRLADRATGLFAAALLLADPLYLRQSVTLQADGPALALAFAAVAAAVLGRDVAGPPRTAVAGLAGALLGLAWMVKLLALPAALPVALLLWPNRGALAAAAAGGLGAMALLLVPFFDRLDLVLRQSVGLHLGSGAAALTNLGDLWLLARWELPAAGLAVAAIVLLRRTPLVLTAAAWLLLTGISFLFVKPLWPHHLVAAAVPLALLAAPAAAAAGRRLPVAVAAAVAALMVAATILVIGLQGPSKAAEAARIAALTAPSEVVVTDDQFAAAEAGRSTPPELVDTSFVRVRSGDLGLSQVQAVARRDGVRLVVLESGRLRLVPGLLDWTATAFPTREQAGDAALFEAP